MATSDRGFASMNKKKQREIASKGGRLAHVKRPGKKLGHEWTRQEAREAGQYGGAASSLRKRAAKLAEELDK